MPSATDVVRECLAQILPPGVDSPVEARADLIVAALTDHGHLKAEAAAPSDTDVAEAALYLAGRSRHPRYTQGNDGWLRLKQSTVDVEMAATQAVKHVPPSEVETIGRAKALLLAWHAAQPDEASL